MTVALPAATRTRPPGLTCGVRLAVVLAAVLHLDRRQAQGLDHLVRPLAPVRGAEGRHGQREGQRGEGQGQQGPVPPGHLLQHGGGSPHMDR